MKKSLLIIALLSIFSLNAQTTDVVSGFSFPYALALNGNELFISDTPGTISKIDITSATPIPSEVVTGVTNILGMAIHGNFLYFSSLSQNTIYKIDITSVSPTVIDVVTGLNGPIGLAFKGNELFIAEYLGNKISKIDITSATPSPSDVVIGINSPVKLTFKDNELYFSSEVDGKIAKIEDVTAIPPSVIDVVTGLMNPVGIAIKSNDLYVAEPEIGISPNKIYKIDITDNSPILTEVITGLDGPRGIVFNGDVLYIAEGPAGKISKVDVQQVLERDALIALYNSTDGANWNNNTNWNTTEPVSTWHGVTVVDGYVTKIIKTWSNLTGTLPVELQNLTHLETLRIFRNNLSGAIPDLTGLTALSELNINYNYFQFGDFENEFSSYNTNIDNFRFTVMNNVESEIDIDLVVGDTYVMTMPVINGTGVTYQWFKNDIAITGETGLTFTITNAQEGAAGNYTCKASSSIITDLVIEREPINIYREILASDRDALIALYNATDGANWNNNTNWNTAVPVYEWYGVTVSDNRVIEIDLAFNNLVGVLPTQIGDLTKLEKLRLRENRITGTIPVEIGNCTSLTDLNLWVNNLTGNIPSELGNCTNLELLSLEDNQLTGNIPESFSNLTAMGSFWVNGNLLSGDIPDIFSNWSDLYYFSIGDINNSGSYNNFTGALDLSNNTALYGIWVDNSNISSLNIKNGNNSIITRFDVTNTPNLTCITADGNDISDISQVMIDSGKTFSTDCNGWGVVGSATPNSWGWYGPDLPLSYDEVTNNWSAVVTLTDGEIKFRFNNDWAVNYGDNGANWILDQNGANITVSAGDYLVTANFDTLEYSIKSALVLIPDPNFEQALIDLGIDSDGIINQQILRTDAENAIELIANFPIIQDQNGVDIPNPFADPRVTITTKIADLTGIEAFISLEKLGASYGEITTVDLSQNTKLYEVFISDNLLSEIDVSKNTLLTRFGVMRNPDIGSLDVSNNLLLEELFVDGTAMTSIDVSINTNLWKFWSRWGNLTGIDLSNNINLRDVRLRGSTNLTYANVKNGNNLNIEGFDFRDTPNLTCITADGTTVPEVSQLMFNFSNGLLSTDCGTVYIPDPIFEKSLVQIGIDSDGTINGQVLRTDVFEVTELILTNPLSEANPLFHNELIDLDPLTERISNLTGIEAFTSLTKLGLSYSDLTTVDLSYNIELDDLFFSDAQLIEIDISKNILLTRFGVMRNPDIATLDVSHNLLLEELFVDGTAMTSIDVSINTNLWKFYGRWGNLTGIDLSENTNLRDVRLRGSSNLTYVNVKNGNNSIVEGFDVRDMPSLTCITADGIAEPEVSALMLGFSNGLLSTDCGTVYIPDSNFEQALIDSEIDQSGILNGVILRSEAETQTGRLGVCCRNINDLTGVEAFVNITELQAGENNLTEIDVTKNTELIKIWTYKNQLSNIDLSQNIKMERISVGENQLTSLDASMLPEVHTVLAYYNQLTNINLSNLNKLTRLDIRGNKLINIDVTDSPQLDTFILEDNVLTSLDLTENINLKFLWARNNQLSNINATNNTILETIDARNNSIENINISQNGMLKRLFLTDNPITSLDLSNNPNLTALYIENNIQLSSLDLRNGNNIIIDNFLSDNTPSLTCINADGIDFPDISQTMKDSGKTFSQDCGDFVYIPDANFEQALIDLGIDSDGVVNTSVLSEDVVNIGWLDISNSENGYGIQDLMGIEAFTSLTGINCSFNQIESLDFSSNINLVDVYAGINGTTSINVSNNSNLEQLFIDRNQISELNLSNNPNLKVLIAYSNLLTNLDVSSLTNLETIHVGSNLLTSLNIANTINTNFVGTSWDGISLHTSPNINLACIQVDSGIAGNIPSNWEYDLGVVFTSDCATKPEYVYIPDDNFEQSLIDLGFDSDGAVNDYILISDAEAVTSLNLNNTLFTPAGYGFNNSAIVNVAGKINDLTGIEAFINLTNLQVSYSDLITINVSSNVLLQELWITDGILESINVDFNTNLIRLGLMRNNISSPINLSQNGLLEWLFINNNQILNLDITLNTSLSWLDAGYNSGLTIVTDAILGSPTLTSLNLSGTGLSNYTGASYPNIAWLLLNDNNLTRFNGNNSPLVENLFLNNNNIDKLVLSSNASLKQLHAENNVLNELDLRNGNNIAIPTLSVTGNLLTCISVDDPTDVTMPYASWNIDLGTVLSLDCKAEPEVILIPNGNFEDKLIADLIDTNGKNGNILVSDAEAVLNLNVSGQNIIDLTGIEGFVNLTVLDASNNALNSINLLANADLIELNVSMNNLTELFVNSGRNLVTLDCSSNMIHTLNLSNLTDLVEFNGSSNAFQSIDATSHSNLLSFNISTNELYELDMRNGNNTAITLFDATENLSLNCIGVDDETTIPGGWLKDVHTEYTSSGDCTAPIVQTQDITIGIDRNGIASVTAAEIDFGSSDNISTSRNLTLSIDQSNFDCSHLGMNVITLTVTDEAGNSASETAEVTVLDLIAPTAVAVRSLSHDLNGSAGFTLLPEDIDAGSSDNCGNLVLSLDDDFFALPGIYTVTLIASDGTNSDTDTTVLEVVDTAISGTELSFGGLTLTVYPVPFSNVINISFSKTTDISKYQVSLLNANTLADTEIQFYDNGQSITSGDTSSLSNGVGYIISINNGKKIKSATIIKE